MLHIVPTPIGNLEDITLRAIRVLREADYILAEDTRTTGRLLKHLEIQNKLRSFHAHNEHRLTPDVISDLGAGQNIALVSDAGTPGISDPAHLLVRACYTENIQITCLPGPTALIPAVVLSGLPSDKFHFEGFLPHKKGRKKRWDYISSLPVTVVLYESPHRLPRFLREAQQYLSEQWEIAVIREISKMHEQVHRGSASELAEYFNENPSKAKGEIVIVMNQP